jgi:hypothetical protein
MAIAHIRAFIEVSPERSRPVSGAAQGRRAMLTERI